jgi:hypothetical protein
MTEFTISAVHSPDWDDKERRRRIAAVYRTILAYRPDSDATDRGEFGDLTRSAASGVPALEPEAQHEV